MQTAKNDKGQVFSVSLLFLAIKKNQDYGLFSTGD
jgi:hypothetical protein